MTRSSKLSKSKRSKKTAVEETTFVVEEKTVIVEQHVEDETTSVPDAKDNAHDNETITVEERNTEEEDHKEEEEHSEHETTNTNFSKKRSLVELNNNHDDADNDDGFLNLGVILGWFSPVVDTVRSLLARKS